jgi:hypothetical protein
MRSFFNSLGSAIRAAATSIDPKWARRVMHAVVMAGVMAAADQVLAALQGGQPMPDSRELLHAAIAAALGGAISIARDKDKALQAQDAPAPEQPAATA